MAYRQESPSNSMSPPSTRLPQMTIKQTYTLGYTAQAKLLYEISSKDGNLRRIVGHTNLMHRLESVLLTAAEDKVVSRNTDRIIQHSQTRQHALHDDGNAMQMLDGPLYCSRLRKTAVVHCEQTQQEEPIEIVAALRMIQSLQAFVASIPPVCVEDDSSDSNSDEGDDGSSDSSESDSDDEDDFDPHTEDDNDLWQIPLMPRSKVMSGPYDSRPPRQSRPPVIGSGASHPSFLPLRGPGSMSWQQLWNDGDVYELWPTTPCKERRKLNGSRAADNSPLIRERHGLAHVLTMSNSSLEI
jgi:hypothetical protein